MYDLLTKLQFSKGVQISIIIFALVVAPYWYCLHFRPHLIETDSVLKLLLPLIAIGGSMMGLNYYLDKSFNLHKIFRENVTGIIDETQLGFFYLQMAAAVSSVILFAPCILKFVNRDASFNRSIGLMASIIGSTIIVRIIFNIKVKKILKQRELDRANEATET